MTHHTHPSRAGRLTIPQTAQFIGVNLGTFIQMRAKGARLFDASFPKMSNGTFSAQDVVAWQSAKSASINLPVSASSPPISTPPTLSPEAPAK